MNSNINNNKNNYPLDKVIGPGRPVLLFVMLSKAGIFLFSVTLSQAHLCLFFVDKSEYNISKVQHNLSWLKLQLVWSYVQTDQLKIIIVVLNLFKCINKYYLSVCLYTLLYTINQLSPATSSHLVEYLTLNIESIYLMSSFINFLKVIWYKSPSRGIFSM